MSCLLYHPFSANGNLLSCTPKAAARVWIFSTLHDRFRVIERDMGWVATLYLLSGKEKREETGGVSILPNYEACNKKYHEGVRRLK